ncbi:MAG: Hsp33 family molecular chaperone HslO [Woeseia sp.]|nr:Hsp33 family molecular chaperone HslO [Woeseia sp.]MBT8096293.1 Hsp33 family molecular chaperone HslO [Woeseia sp.]NNE60111.1 Hsp33 family molecular chaperone HslO [Woeseia sp.]NNL54207.1 Hsp33 family molecular chaperone HslO [Woeseia sp.]
MSESDRVTPFFFESLPVRGALVQLKNSWHRIQLNQHYEQPVLEVLGHAAAASALIAQSLKFEGQITLQITGKGPLSMLVMQCTSDLALRGMARAELSGADMSYPDLMARAHCAITVDGEDMERPYQGIVEVCGESLAQSLEHYYERSAQLPSHVVLIGEQAVAGGLLLQRMPQGGELDEDDWRRLGLLAATLRAEELRDGAELALLAKLFAEDDLRVLESREVSFHCRCSQQRTEDVLRMLGVEEAEQALGSRGRIDVTCEYCGRLRSFDEVDVKRLFAPPAGQASSRLH